ncbi:MAG: hypothetical protein QM811_23380 [Pirellulales bacterium]
MLNRAPQGPAVAPPQHQVVTQPSASTPAPTHDTNQSAAQTAPAHDVVAQDPSHTFAMPDPAAIAAATPRFDGAQLSWVGYRVADGITPVTSGVSSALESLKRPLAKPEVETPIPAPQENGRSSGLEYLTSLWV